jgi:hypothetical protein
MYIMRPYGDSDGSSVVSQEQSLVTPTTGLTMYNQSSSDEYFTHLQQVLPVGYDFYPHSRGIETEWVGCPILIFKQSRMLMDVTVFVLY